MQELPKVTEQSIHNAAKASRVGGLRRTAWHHPDLPSTRLNELLAQLDQTQQELAEDARPLSWRTSRARTDD